MNATKNPDGSAVKPAVDVWRDMAPNADYKCQSWFAVGHFVSEGHTLNYLYHVLTSVTDVPGIPATAVVSISVTDETSGKYYSDLQTYPLDAVKIAADRFSIQAPNSCWYGDSTVLHLEASAADFALKADMVPGGCTIYNSGAGIIEICSIPMYQYSIPTMHTTGTLTLEGKDYVLDGNTWLDRQWGGKDIGSGAHEAPMWGWMNPRLDDGTTLSLWFTIEHGDVQKAWATVLTPDGVQTVVDVEPMLEKAGEPWKSPASPFTYPTRWKVCIPDRNCELTVVSAPAEQELTSPMPALCHYEAASTVTGTWQGQATNGYCYVELFGNWTAK